MLVPSGPLQGPLCHDRFIHRQGREVPIRPGRLPCCSLLSLCTMSVGQPMHRAPTGHPGRHSSSHCTAVTAVVSPVQLSLRGLAECFLLYILRPPYPIAAGTRPCCSGTGWQTVWCGSVWVLASCAHALTLPTCHCHLQDIGTGSFGQVLLARNVRTNEQASTPTDTLL